MKYKYNRVSTKGQSKDENSLEVQERAVREAGAEKIFSDFFGGTTIQRLELDNLLEQLALEDTLIVKKLDRIARTATQIFLLVQSLLENGISVHVLNMGLMDQSPTGKLILHIMLAFAEFERNMIMERTSKGKAMAKANAAAQGKNSLREDQKNLVRNKEFMR